MKLTRSIVLAIAICTAAPAGAQKEPGKIKLSAASKDGAVLVRVPVQPFPSALQFSKNGKSGFMSRVYLMKVDPGASGFQYIARTLSPGRYRLDSVWQQGHWGACLENGTFEFDVRPGEIAYVGTLRTDVLLQSLQQRAVASGKAVQAGTSYFLSHGGTEGPLVEGTDQTGLAAAREFAEVSMNSSGELVRLANLQSAQFATSGAGRAIKVCG